MYKSTRGNSAKVTAKEAIIYGLADDGGLYVPEDIAALDLNSLTNLPYQQLAKTILRPYLNFSDDELGKCVSRAYDGLRFTNKLIAPLVTPLKGEESIHFLELFHGPTLAFKDMALSILPHLMKASSYEGELVILTATSGDTGKAALEAFCGVEGVKIVVFYPKDGVSDVQKLQMMTQEGDNTYVYGIEGNFDDAQTGVKNIFNNQDFCRELSAKGKRLSSANSINIGRLLPQIVYYFYAYGQLAKKGRIKVGDKINFVVPTGNFGNILAGYYAKKMGLPVKKLICASNSNNILCDFLATGEYNRNRMFYNTISPSMDILISSNLERLLYHETNAACVSKMMKDLSASGSFRLNTEFSGFYGTYATEEETRRAIYECRQKGYLIDPHTGVAYHAGRQYAAETGDSTEQIIISTASPFKFAKDVAEALELGSGEINDSNAVQLLSDECNLQIPPAIEGLYDKEKRHTGVYTVRDMENLVSKI